MRSTDRTTKALCAAALIAALSCGPALAQSETTPRGSSSGAPQEGIKVHGDWTLTVRNPDGTMAARHEFKNALAISLGGDSLLAQLLSGATVAGQWFVILATTNIGACNPNRAECSIIENASPLGATSRDLTKTVPVSGPDAGKLILRGSVRFLVNGEISVVSTTLTTCPPSVSPASCAPVTSAPFTIRSLAPSGVPVSQDQLVEVRVVISFS